MKPGAKELFDEWSIYDRVLDHDYMFHDEIFRDVQRLLAEHYGERRFTLLDLGCGSARHLCRALEGRSVGCYAGYDLSDVALAHAKRNLAALGCPVELRHGDLLEGLMAGGERFDLIFSSFALHHLAPADKVIFLQSAYQRLEENGMLLLIDVMREENENRRVYLDRYCDWLRSEWKVLSAEALDALCDHIRNNDFPETTAAFRAMATDAGFSRCVEINRFRWHRTWCFEKSRSRRVRIREADVRDVAAIAKVHVDSWRTTYAGVIPDNYLTKLSYEGRERAWHKNFSDPARRGFVYVAEYEKGEVVGFASGGPERNEDPLYRGEMYAVYLLKHFQRRGIGRQLSLAVAQRLLQAGYESMLVWVLAQNPSRGFYEALGGEVVSEKPIEVGETKLAEVAYGWKDLRPLLGSGK
jgi:SAM-dependent methyltransferase